MRGRRREAVLRVIGELEGRGCAAGGYRMAGPALEHVCCCHLYGSDRMLTVWPADDRAVVVLVGPHSGRAGDVYDQILAALGADGSADARSKPSCCDDEGAAPVDEEAAEAVCDGFERSPTRARRRR